MRPPGLTTYRALPCSCDKVLLEAAGPARPCPACGAEPVEFEARDVQDALEHRKELLAA